MVLKVNKISFIIIKLAISSSLLYFVISKTGFEKVFSTIKNMSLSAFIFAIFLFILAQLISTLRWKLLLPEGPGIKKLFSLCMIGSFFNTFLPGIIGGDTVKGFYLYKLTGKGNLTLSSIFMDRYIGFAVLIMIGIIAYPFGYKYLQGSHMAWVLPFIFLSFIVASLLVFGLRLGNRIKMLSGLYDYFHEYRNQKDIIVKALILSVFIQVSGFFAVYILALGIDHHIPFLAVMIFLPLIILITMLPISISGLGVRESAFVLFFGFVGIKPEAATAISLSWFVAVSAGSLIGLVEYIKYKKEKMDINAG